MTNVNRQCPHCHSPNVAIGDLQSSVFSGPPRCKRCGGRVYIPAVFQRALEWVLILIIAPVTWLFFSRLGMWAALPATLIAGVAVIYLMESFAGRCLPVWKKPL